VCVRARVPRSCVCVCERDAETEKRMRRSPITAAYRQAAAFHRVRRSNYVCVCVGRSLLRGAHVFCNDSREGTTAAAAVTARTYTCGRSGVGVARGVSASSSGRRRTAVSTVRVGEAEGLYRVPPPWHANLAAPRASSSALRAGGRACVGGAQGSPPHNNRFGVFFFPTTFFFLFFGTRRRRRASNAARRVHTHTLSLSLSLSGNRGRSNGATVVPKRHQTRAVSVHTSIPGND